MNKFKDTLWVIGLVVVGLFIEAFRQSTGIPVTIIDILFFPILPLFIFFTIKYFFFSEKRKNKQVINNEEVRDKLWAVPIFLFLMLPLSLWCIWTGFEEPFVYFTGVKGAAHGYTLAAIGITILGFSLFALIYILRDLYKKYTETNN